MQVLLFSSAKQLYCCDLSTVLRVINILQLKAVPGMPHYFKGLMDYYGRQISVVDLIEYLDGDIQLKYTLETPLILMQQDKQMLGLIVEEVLGVYDVDNNEVQALPAVTAKPQIKGAMHIDKNAALMIDVDRLLLELAEGVVGETAS
ncbi:MAG: chemotaxis protein CheW [Coxiellaceae bacterium]|nr:chemotaxis protein CheW [Coxiellaceae bacterium]